MKSNHQSVLVTKFSNNLTRTVVDMIKDSPDISITNIATIASRESRNDAILDIIDNIQKDRDVNVTVVIAKK